jgi:hypothetical protein
MTSIQNNVFKRVHNNVVIDSHLWVVKDGMIIDLTTNVFVDSAIKLGNRLVYFPYSKEKSDEIVNSRINVLKEQTSARGITWDEWLDYFESELLTNKKHTDCVQSSIIYNARNGGEIVAGCFGTYDEIMDKVFWLFGHPDDPEWLKPKGYISDGKYDYLTPITPDLIWDVRTPVNS